MAGGRPPIGAAPMTTAQRVQRHRQNQAAEIVRLRAEVAKLQAEVAELQARLAQPPETP